MAGDDPIIPGEVWYPVPGAPSYEISSEWRVRSFRVRGTLKGGIHGATSDRWRIVRPWRHKNGYLMLTVRDGSGRKRSLYLHRIIAELAFGDLAGDMVRHFDDDKANNFPSNLALGTQADNVADARRNGRLLLGEAHGNAALTEAQVLEIRRLIREARPRQLRAIARRFGISFATFLAIRDRRTWAHLPEPQEVC